MTSAIIWGAAALAYLGFRGWYDNWRGPLRADEIEALLARVDKGAAGNETARAAIRAFLEADDGREFVMFNIVKTTRDLVADPLGGPDKPGIELLNRYARHFIRVLVRRGGHPLIVRRKIGGYVDSWAVGDDPGWSVIGLMRYRSRRDMMLLALDPVFAKHHPDKLAGTLATFSFPTAPQLSLALGPRASVALILALVAALVDLWV
ncbi:MAG: hypothetical protein A4S12_12405 [Proteobacteria bacterium SG_bin5]|nr:hypothetical protein [Sphingomonas sp.]OQW38609.1 MAG: hypothetical protein A4S12_12405 [Proteobacteria bacterium SG_bin5]